MMVSSAVVLLPAIWIGQSLDVPKWPVIFPTTGCWEVTAKSDRSTLTFVTQVLPSQ